MNLSLTVFSFKSSLYYVLFSTWLLAIILIKQTSGFLVEKSDYINLKVMRHLGPTLKVLCIWHIVPESNMDK